PKSPEAASIPRGLDITRASPEEKHECIRRLEDFHRRHGALAPDALAKLKAAALDGSNLFEQLLEATRVCSLGQITHALYEVGGEYRRNL
ncbi:MAG: hypothetical protein AAFY88_21610, partial [Acidobacteriota bacterium]